MTDIVLEEGEEICSRCEGEGWIKKDAAFPSLPGLAPRCSKCNGAGKLDWISNAMGEPPRPEYGPAHNVFIGYDAGMVTTTGNKNVCIGYQAGMANGHNKIKIGEKACERQE